MTTDNTIDFDRIAPVTFYKGQDVRRIIRHVISHVESMVTSTMGPNGKLAVISFGTEPKTTKDGVTVARSIKFTNEAAEYINRIITEPALKTDEECGDGTTTTIFLTKGLYGIMEQFNSFRDHQFIEELVGGMIKQLEKQALIPRVNGKRLMDLALTSSNNDKRIAKTIVDIYRKSKKGAPSIEVRPGSSSDDKVENIQGLPLTLKFANPAFSGRGTGEDTELKDYVAVGVDTMLAIANEHEANRVGEQLIELGQRYPNKTIVLVARSMENSFCSLVATLRSRHQINFVPLTTGHAGALGTLLLGDAMTVLNGRLVTDIMDINTVELEANDLDVLVAGSDRSVLSTISEKTQDRINQRIEEVSETLKSLKQQDRFSLRSRFTEKRLRDLKGELVVVYVGGETQSEVKERIDRYVDVDKAVTSALVNGILPGAGYAMRQVGHWLMKEHWSEDNEFTRNRIVEDLVELCFNQYAHLYSGMPFFDESLFNELMHETRTGEIEEKFSTYINLATGKEGKPQDIGIFDTAYASITALRGGLKTAKILAQTDTILLGSKLGAAKF